MKDKQSYLSFEVHDAAYAKRGRGRGQGHCQNTEGKPTDPWQAQRGSSPLKANAEDGNNLGLPHCGMEETSSHTSVTYGEAAVSQPKYWQVRNL